MLANIAKQSHIIGSCPKCGITNKSGLRSCCARGGAWFKKCGDPGDTNFGHTWLEGFHACRSSCHIHVLYLPAYLARHLLITQSWPCTDNAMSTATTTTPAIESKKCFKCGYIEKLGRFSCCARGGAWFNKCGDPGDTNFDVTWLEGFETCESECSKLCVLRHVCIVMGIVYVHRRDSLMFTCIFWMLFAC